MRYQFAGKSALVAGATGGLGRALATELHSRGADLTLVSRSQDRLAALPVGGQRLALDLRDPTNCQLAVRRAVEHHRRLDLVVNAVGVVAFGAMTDMTVDTIEELFLTNTILPMILSREALPELPRGGVIVNISGAIAERNVAGMSAYGASKSALASFDEAFGREARRLGVRVIDARPPHSETGLVERAIEGTAPRLGEGLEPATVATVICDAIAGDERDLQSSAFEAARHPDANAEVA